MKESFGQAYPGTTDAIWVDRGPRIMSTNDMGAADLAKLDPGARTKLRTGDAAARRKYLEDQAAYEQSFVGSWTDEAGGPVGGHADDYPDADEA